MSNFISAILNWFKSDDATVINNSGYNIDEIGDMYIPISMFDDLFN